MTPGASLNTSTPVAVGPTPCWLRTAAASSHRGRSPWAVVKYETTIDERHSDDADAGADEGPARQPLSQRLPPVPAHRRDADDRNEAVIPGDAPRAVSSAGT